MELLSYTFQFVRDVHLKLTNKSGGIAKLRRDYYIKNASTINIYNHITKTIKIEYEKLRCITKKMIR